MSDVSPVFEVLLHAIFILHARGISWCSIWFALERKLHELYTSICVFYLWGNAKPREVGKNNNVREQYVYIKGSSKNAFWFEKKKLLRCDETEEIGFPVT